ncbi:MAG: flagellar biosynthesis protein FlhF, partial [Spirochaetota bacterium]
MEYFVEQAPTHREAEERVRTKYGDAARIMHHRSVRIGGFLGMFTREGVEVTGYFSREPRRQVGTDALSRPVERTQAAGVGSNGGASATGENSPPGASGPVPARGGGGSLDEEKRKLLDVMRGGDKTLDTVLSEIRSLRDSLGGGHAEEHPTIAEVRLLLEQNDFSPDYVRTMTDRMRRELSVEELSDRDGVHARVVEWIGQSIRIHEPRSTGKPEILILVGPTGVGKTTTIAKLAAMYGLERSKKARDIRVLTIDNYRIGARQQIETYGQIMDIPV